MKLKNIIYIIIEIARRELDSKIILALKAKENNFDVAITKKSRIFSVLKYLKSGIVFLKSFGPRYNPILDDIKKYGFKLAGIDEEGLQVSYNEHLTGKLRFSKLVFKDLQYLFTWGLNSKKIYTNYAKKHKLDHKKIISTGSPRVDILKKRYNKIFFDKDNKLQKKKFILIATQFLKYNRSGDNFETFDKTEFEKEIVITHKKNKFSKGKNFKIELDKFAKAFYFQEKNFLEYDKMYSFLCKKFPKELFLIKPHPGEGIQYYKQLEKKFKNLKIITDNSNIIKWILASKLLISCNCTTSIEARLLNKSSINYMPYKNLQREYELPKLTSINVRNLNDLAKIIKDKSYMKFKLDKKKETKILYNLENFKDKYGVDQIINYLKKIQIRHKNLKNLNENLFFKFYLFLRSNFHSLIGIFNYELYRNQLGKRGEFTLKKLNTRLDEIQIILFKKKKYKFNEKFYGIYTLEEI